MTSDRRLKKNIQSCPIDRVKRLYDSCEVKLYDWIESENKPGQEIGLIAQDLVSAHLTDLISIFYRDDIEGGEDPSLEPAKQQLNVDYSRISAYNMKMIQHLLGEIDRLKDLRKVDFGARGYAQYRDQTPLKAFSHLDHNDEERRHRYYLRHKVDYPEPSADFYAKKFLW
ncbi:putative intramolecular chaperone auto-processing domain-containing protein [Plasmopara halstedii]